MLKICVIYPFSFFIQEHSLDVGFAISNKAFSEKISKIQLSSLSQTFKNMLLWRVIYLQVQSRFCMKIVFHFATFSFEEIWISNKNSMSNSLLFGQKPWSYGYRRSFMFKGSPMLMDPHLSQLIKQSNDRNRNNQV